MDKTILARRAVRISNELYGSDDMSSFKISKGYKGIKKHSWPI